jgi:outer membrane protein assembly factor BamB
MIRILFFASFLYGPAAAFADWPQFRGPGGTGVAAKANPPVTWGNTEDEENVAWRRDLPGRGPSSPIVIGNHVVITCSSGVEQDRLHVLCFDAMTGAKRWERQFWATGRTLTHPTSANAAPTPVSDGNAIYAFFSSNDLICLELKGDLRWYRGLGNDFPKAGNDVGMSSSPLVIHGTVVVQIEAQGDSFVAGVDAETGETRWRIDRRPEASWSSPTALSREGADEAKVLLQAPHGLTAVDARDGRELWKYDASCSAISSPVVSQNRIFLPSNGLTALDIPTDSTGTQFVWDASRLRPGAGSAAVHQGKIYLVNDAGVLVCGDTATGEVLWQLRLEGRCWATPIVTDERVYVFNSDGKAFVVQQGEKGKIIGRSDFGESIQGTPAISGDALYVRSDRHLWKIASKGPNR